MFFSSYSGRSIRCQKTTNCINNITIISLIRYLEAENNKLKNTLNAATGIIVQTYKPKHNVALRAVQSEILRKQIRGDVQQLSNINK